MKKILFVLASALTIVCACSKGIAPSETIPAKEEIDIPEGYTLYELTSSLSKLAIDGMNLSWEAGDSIKLVTDKGQYVSLPLTKGGTSASFYFVIPVGDTPLYGVSPATLKTSVNGEQLMVSFPTDQSAKLTSANVMCGQVDAGSIAFKNIAHLIKFSTENADMSRVQICELSGNKVITGKVGVLFEGGEVSVNITEEETSSSFSSTVEGAGTYYIAVLPGSDSWSGFGIRTATGTPGNYSYSTGYIGTKEITPSRNTITNLGNIDGLFETEVSPKDGTELRNLLNIANNTAKCWYLNGKTVNLGEATYQVETSYIFNDNISEGVNFKLIGQGADKTIIDAGGTHSIFSVGENVCFDASGITFQNGLYAYDGGGILFKASAVFGQTTFTNCTFKGNKTSGTASGGALAVRGAKVVIDNCYFTENYANNGACLYTDVNDNACVEVSNSTFKSNNSLNTGGVANLSKGTQKYKNCTFESNSTKNGTGGAMHINASNAVVTLDNCTFKDNEGFTSKPWNSNIASVLAAGAISIQEGDLTINGCTFDGNKGSAGSALVIQPGSGYVKVNNSTFKNNKCRSHGVFYVQDKNVLFMNNCKIYENTMYTNAWAQVIQGDKACAICLNNCTIYKNASATGGSATCLNVDGSLVCTNTTVINDSPARLVRNNLASNTVVIANSILLNTISSTGVVFQSGAMACKAFTYNCYIGPTTSLTTNWTSSNDKTGVTSLDGGSWNPTTGAYTWNGPDGTFIKAKESEVKGYLDAMTLNNGNTRVNGAFGPKFAAWVDSLGGFEKDMLGTARTTAGTWPGAIEVK